jgi:transposase
MSNYIQKWMDQLKWQRLTPFEKLADMLLKHPEGILSYCRTKVRFGAVEAVDGNIRMLINRGRGCVAGYDMRCRRHADCYDSC